MPPVPAASSSREPLVVESVTASGSALEAVVRVTDPRWLRTSAIPGLAEEVLHVLPGLVRHRCECGSARGIASELADTETPHLLEHVTLEIAVLAGSPRTLAGRTRWDFARDGRGVFRVRLEFTDEAVMRAALDVGVEVVRALFGKGEMPDVEAAAGRLSNG